MHATPRSLRAQFIEAFTILILLSACVLAAITGRETSKENRYERGLLLTNRAQTLARSLDQSMWFWVKEVDTLRRMLALADGNTNNIVHGFHNLQSSMPAFTWVGLVNPQGKIIAHTAPALADNDLSSCNHFQQGRKGLYITDIGKDVRLDALLSQSKNIPPKFVDISMPIEEGTLAGWVIIARLGWLWAKEVETFMLSGEGSDTTAETFVLSENGTPLLGERPGEGMLSLERLHELETSPSVWAEEIWPDGNSYLTAAVVCSGYKDYAGLQWNVVARQSLEVAYAPVRKLVSRILVAGLVLALLFALVAHYIAQRTIAPLKKLTEAADKLSKGESVGIPQHQSIREIEVLSSSLASLVDNLSRSETARKHIQNTAERDELTGLLNRHGLAARVAEAIPRLKKEHRKIEALYMDLDGFKPINDTHGHHVGDAVLSILAQRLTRCLRKDDVLVRLGGDEFLALLGNGKDMPDVSATMARIHTAVSSPIAVEGQRIIVGISIGHSTWECEEENLEDALKRADHALYKNKNSGRHSAMENPEDLGMPA